MVEARN